ncbi:MAG: hypothetical protein OJF52_001481 [Nitrospira sp.]|jgi:hypothetical protein|nr:MAG: hypothetical protein OJF52_001481 [Nitrospira sp.]
MSHFLERFLFFRETLDTFSGKHGVVKREDRTWENAHCDRCLQRVTHQVRIGADVLDGVVARSPEDGRCQFLKVDPNSLP